jgi:hypothetical protein
MVNDKLFFWGFTVGFWDKLAAFLLLDFWNKLIPLLYFPFDFSNSFDDSSDDKILDLLIFDLSNFVVDYIKRIVLKYIHNSQLDIHFQKRLNEWTDLLFAIMWKDKCNKCGVLLLRRNVCQLFKASGKTQRFKF